MLNRTPEQPELGDEFSHLAQYWDAKEQAWAVKILPGEFFISATGGLISTVLGSCVAVCMRDRRLGVGGMNHFMLPEVEKTDDSMWGTTPVSLEARYGNWAMEYLINGILKLGGKKEDLEVKVFGGGEMLASMSDVGQRNTHFTFEYLAQEGLKIDSSDVGGVFARKVTFFPETGEVKMQKISNSQSAATLQRDSEYQTRVSGSHNLSVGSVDLF